jgi:uncharacterized protein YbgA (DUF1722 family)
MGLRENSVERVFVHYGWTCLLEKDPRPGGLVSFHTAHKLSMMARSPQHCQKMDRLVARAGNLPWPELVDTHGQGLVPLVVPLTLLKHCLSRHPVAEWVHQQVCLNPYPKDLMLRNHV